jgi:hypothetical protein
MSELRTVEARIRALTDLERFAGKRPEITADIAALTARRKRLKAEEMRRQKEAEAYDQDDRGGIPPDDRPETRE